MYKIGDFMSPSNAVDADYGACQSVGGSELDRRALGRCREFALRQAHQQVKSAGLGGMIDR
jgi:hypothetical protein